MIQACVWALGCPWEPEEVGRIDSQLSGRTADPSTALRFGRDDKGRGMTHLGSCYSDGESFRTYSFLPNEQNVEVGADEKQAALSYREPHTWLLPTPRSRKSGYAPVGMTSGECLHGQFKAPPVEPGMAINLGTAEAVPLRTKTLWSVEFSAVSEPPRQRRQRR